ncbi:hypothetical protein O0544_20745 [Edwardsiella anguillarum]|nr:hypothetical protein [Edwardsiella anguillarum]
MKPRDITPEEEYDDDLYDPLIYPTSHTPDDRCDHTAQLIWHMRQRATIRSGAAWTPCPRPVPSEPTQRRRAPTRLNIGLRRSYSSTIITAVYQLHLRHTAAHEIAALLGIPPKKWSYCCSIKPKPSAAPGNRSTKATACRANGRSWRSWSGVTGVKVRVLLGG